MTIAWQSAAESANQFRLTLTTRQTPKSYPLHQFVIGSSVRGASAMRISRVARQDRCVLCLPGRRIGVFAASPCRATPIAGPRCRRLRSARRPAGRTSPTIGCKRRSARSCPAACARPAGHSRASKHCRSSTGSPMRSPTRTGCGNRLSMRSSIGIGLLRIHHAGRRHHGLSQHELERRGGGPLADVVGAAGKPVAQSERQSERQDRLQFRA